ncbi:myo-inosose-2 dehydratase [Lederbergia citrea]|uniref:Inosose dehydratase n=1 Tax=Lederbergia citrea TaxID=2833581 RepID=A0A942UP32_9BACI|nr:myo-inosose-2 dehydratase [Lederbergia citrea]MBS4179507.1 myo-inosose-2 dehydratase [Lederbergia citrea]MBS4206174.1 myo-inosose-2 dehydratase [Lederbergia citrea]MBS4224890.1 myo-inosose-2 dehydratase [Lederbergia citrea]
MFEKNAVKLGIAPIGWTNDDLPELGGENTFEQCISEMALAGFTGSEVGNKYPRDIPVLQKALKLRNLEIASAWFSAFLTTKPFDETKTAFLAHRDFLYEMGAKVIVVSEQGYSIQGQQETPLFAEKPIFTEDDWGKLASGLNKLGELAQEKDMKLVYHHHMGTGVQTTEEINQLMEMTDENLVYLLYDTGHLYFSGENPLEVLENHMSRIKHVHLKDVRPEVAKMVKQDGLSFLTGVKEGVFTVPGNGAVDFKPIFEILAQSGYEGWMIVEAEQDPSKANPFEYALMARNYIKETAGV